jgi:glycosyltransferase involved in cell wall biosynthesis
MRIVQFLPTLSYGDAVGNDAIAIDKILFDQGYETKIYAENIDPRYETNRRIRHVKNLPELRSDDILIYHLSTGGSIAYTIPGLSCRKICRYHNITPPQYFIRYDNYAFQNALEGHRQQIYLSSAFDYVLADSSFNAESLRKIGWKCPIDILPVIVPYGDYDRKPSSNILAKYDDDCVNLMFCGRVASNKKHEDIIAAFWYYHKLWNPNSRLFLVGGYDDKDKYHRKLASYVSMLGLDGCVKFTAHIKFEEVLAYYTLADVFLCASEHEGFCVPLCESMKFDVPIVAFPFAAVPETLGGTGVLLNEADPLLMAGAVNELMSNVALRSHIIGTQRERLRSFSYENIKKQFVSYLNLFLENLGEETCVCNTVVRRQHTGRGGSRTSWLGKAFAGFRRRT